jgi:hypothetical protein
MANFFVTFFTQIYLRIEEDSFLGSFFGGRGVAVTLMNWGDVEKLSCWVVGGGVDSCGGDGLGWGLLKLSELAEVRVNILVFGFWQLVADF